MSEVRDEKRQRITRMIIGKVMQTDPMSVSPRQVLRHHRYSGGAAPLLVSLDWKSVRTQANFELVLSFHLGSVPG